MYKFCSWDQLRVAVTQFYILVSYFLVVVSPKSLTVYAFYFQPLKSDKIQMWGDEFTLSRTLQGPRAMCTLHFRHISFHITVVQTSFQTCIPALMMQIEIYKIEWLWCRIYSNMLKRLKRIKTLAERNLLFTFLFCGQWTNIFVLNP